MSGNNEWQQKSPPSAMQLIRVLSLCLQHISGECNAMTDIPSGEMALYHRWTVSHVVDLSQKVF